MTDVEDSKDAVRRRAWPRARQWRVLIILSVAIAVLLGIGWIGGRIFGSREAAVEAAQSPPGTFRPTAQQLKSLSVEPVTMHSFVSQELTEGKIAVNGNRATPVFSPYSGRVMRVIAGLGDAVERGTPLATVAASEFVQIQNDLNNAVSQLKLVRITESRKHALYEAKGGSLQDWQQAQADLATAETALKSIRNRLRILNKSEADIANLEKAGYIDPVASILAPIRGVVVDRQVGPGQFLQAGSGTPLFTIADLSTVWLVANVREADAPSVRLGQPVEVHVLAYPQRIFKAHVTFVATSVDPNTRRLPVRAEIDNRDRALKTEMFATFRILTSGPEYAPAVPESAVVYEGDVAHVWVMQAGDVIAPRAIKPGRTNDGVVEVLDGLKSGERIVTKGSLFIDRASS